MIQRQSTILLLTVLSLLLMVLQLQAAQVQLSWSAPTKNADGSPLNDLAGYKVYYGLASRSYGTPIDVGNTTTYTITGLTGGVRYYFAVKAYDTSRNESAFSTEVSFVPPLDPSLVANFTATPTSGTAPLAVTFTDTSTGTVTITSWSWKFGDGGTSTQRNVTYTYKNPGTYDVTLTVSGGGLSNTVTKKGYITVSQPPASSSGLVAAYSFDEGTGTKVNDASGNGNHGTLINGPKWEAGKYGKALSFDGVNDHVLVPNSSSLDIAGTKLTLSLWVNITDRSGPDMVLLSKPWASSSMPYPWHQYAIEFDANGAKTLDFMFGDTSGTLRAFSMKPPVGVWTHVAFTYDGTTVKGYLNGVQKLSVPSTQSIQARGQSLRIGVDGAFGQAFKGKMDQVRIYNRALTASEIQADMNTPIK